MWSGHVYLATESKELRFHFLHKGDPEPIGYETKTAAQAQACLEA
jgi:non-homologous end joining protein Ku